MYSKEIVITLHELVPEKTPDKYLSTDSRNIDISDFTNDEVAAVIKFLDRITPFAPIKKFELNTNEIWTDTYPLSKGIQTPIGPVGWA